MALPRSKYVLEGQEGVYHCFSRCVRRAFLCGFDTLTGRDFSHRKALLVERLRYLAAVFAIEVCAYSVMANHYHVILRTRPDIVALWSDQDVARRWLNGILALAHTTMLPSHITQLGRRPELCFAARYPAHPCLCPRLAPASRPLAQDSRSGWFATPFL